ncbi:MAG: hypothetical protein K6T87_23155, partial [Roseiflexus sp.]|uniref:hypothetical protein n=1 Tax=Roseiflexus sp. TaxID=2562120 RepID=UPI0025E0690C
WRRSSGRSLIVRLVLRLPKRSRGAAAPCLDGRAPLCLDGRCAALPRWALRRHAPTGAAPPCLDGRCSAAPLLYRRHAPQMGCGAAPTVSASCAAAPHRRRFTA